MLIAGIFLTAGFILLALGAEFLVRGASNLALRLGISPLVVGLTIVAFGTSAPELAVSIRSTLSGLGGLALGNVIGSNIANIGLILGITALLSPIRIQRQLLRRQIPLVIGTSILLWVLLLDNALSRFDGVILSSGLLAFFLYSYRQVAVETGGEDLSISDPDAGGLSKKLAMDIAFILAGMALLVFGSTLFVDSAVTIARFFDISEAVIGLTLVAVGTSIPELATCVVAAYRKHADIAIGNVVGSNLFNILGVLGVTAMIETIDGEQIKDSSFIIMILFSLALYPFARSRLKLDRVEGAFLLSSYVVYLVYVVRLG